LPIHRDIIPLDRGGFSFFGMIDIRREVFPFQTNKTGYGLQYFIGLRYTPYYGICAQYIKRVQE
jgi:hypothetical protein